MTSSTQFDVLDKDLDRGRFLIEASAGTGKTFNIQHLYLRQILEKGLEVRQILVVTFTEAATAELRKRIRENLANAYDVLQGRFSGEDVVLKAVVEKAKSAVPEQELAQRVRLAIVSFDEAAIFTIHGFCSRMLSENAFESGIAFDTELVQSQDDMIAEVVWDFWRTRFYGDDQFAGVLLKRAGITPDGLVEFATKVIRTPDMTVKYDSTCLMDLDGPAIADAAVTLVDGIKDAKVSGSKAKPIHDNLLAFMSDHTVDPAHPENLARAFSIAIQLTNKSVVPIKDAFLPLLAPSIKKELYEYLRNDAPLAARKKKMRVQSYDDMLLDLRKALQDDTGNLDPDSPMALRIRDRYCVALIDEFQDTDPVQYAIFDTIFNHDDCLFLMIGDPKQSIYKFRGADIYAYLDAKEGATSRTLIHNYRSTQELLDGVNTLFSRDLPFVEDKIAYEDVDAGKAPSKRVILPDMEKPFQLHWVVSTEPDGVAKTNVSGGIGEYVAEQVVGILNASSRGDAYFESTSTSGTSKIQPKDLAVLVNTNVQAQEMQKALKRRSVPSVIARAGNVFSSSTAMDLYLLMRGIGNPGYDKHLKTALQTSFVGFTDDELSGLVTDDSDAALAYWSELFHEYGKTWEKKGVMATFTRLLQSENLAPERALNEHASVRTGLEFMATVRGEEDDRERHVTNLRHLMELLHHAEQGLSLSRDALIRWLKERIEKSDAEKDEEAYEMRLETDRDSVVIMTIHKSKGLQFPIVFVPFLWNNNYDTGSDKDWSCHDRSEVVMPLDTVTRTKHVGQFNRESLGEALRVAYVGVTRAEHFCAVVYGNLNGDSAKTSLNYLLPDAEAAAGNGYAELDDFLAGPKLPGNDVPRFDTIQAVKCHQEDVADQPTTPRTQQTMPTELSPPQWPDGVQVPKHWGVMSYTSLASHERGGLVTELAGRNDEAAPGEELESTGVVGPTFVDFPGGAHTGSCVHEIFEDLDYSVVKGAGPEQWCTDPTVQAIIEEKMRKWGRIRGNKDSETYRNSFAERYPMMCEMIHRTLTTPILESGYSLNHLKPNRRVAELDFFFDISGEVDKETLNTLLPKVVGSKVTDDEQLNALLDALRIHFSTSQVQTGFMTGSIDLVFEEGGKYYFLDWKTDRLGDSFSAYRPFPNLWAAMVEHAYILQYFIYSLALHRYLKVRLPGYSFEAHFGGGLYLFVRGIDGGPDRSGIFSHCIDADTLDDLEKAFPEAGGTCHE